MSSYTGIQRFTRSITFMRRSSVLVRLIIAAILIFFAIFPVLWIVSSALNPANSLATAKLIPDNWGFDNFYILLPPEDGTIREFSANTFGRDLFPAVPEGKYIFPFWTWWWNSIKIASISTVLSLTVTTLAAYAFSRFRFKGRQTMLKAILLIQVFPNLLALVAIFLMIAEVGDIIPTLGLDTHAGLIMVYTGGAMGINIWLMRGFLDTIPRDIDEYAMVDGASNPEFHRHLWRLCPGPSFAQDARAIYVDGRIADIYFGTILSKVGSIRGRRLDWGLAHYGYLLAPAGSNCGWADSWCSQGINDPPLFLWRPIDDFTFSPVETTGLFYIGISARNGVLFLDVSRRSLIT